jgi:Flp pilus assembly protein CpaB
MRVNRSVRIGLLLVGAAVILLILLRGFSSWLNPAPAPRPVVAENNTVNSVQPVSWSANQYAVLTRSIPERTIITPDMLVMKPVPGELQGDKTAFRRTYVTNIGEEALGFVTNRPLTANMPLRKEQLMGHISQIGIAAVLAPDRRAMVVPITNKPALHPIVHIGDYVDVTAAFSGQEAKIIVDNVRVLAVDVFVKDYPPTSVAARGPFKAPAKGVPEVQPQVVVNPQGTPVPAGEPTPTPAPQGPPPTASPALTLEVTPMQANSINLAQNASALIDFLIRPAPTIPIGPAPVGTFAPVRLVSTSNDVTITQLAPMANRKTGAGGTSTAASSAKASGGSGTRHERPSPSRGTNFESFPPPVLTSPTQVLPAKPLPPPTYDIPIYVDGKVVRVDTVRKPGTGNEDGSIRY